MPIPPLHSPIGAAREQGKFELLLANVDGRIAFAKPRTRRWLRDFFPRHRAYTRLPQALRTWIASASNGDRHTVSIQTGKSEMVVRLASANAEKLFCLALEVRPKLRAQNGRAG